MLFLARARRVLIEPTYSITASRQITGTTPVRTTAAEARKTTRGSYACRYDERYPDGIIRRGASLPRSRARAFVYINAILKVFRFVVAVNKAIVEQRGVYASICYAVKSGREKMKYFTFIRACIYIYMYAEVRETERVTADDNNDDDDDAVSR